MGYVSIRIPDELHTQLKIIAAEKKKHLKDVIIEALEEFVKRMGGGESGKYNLN